MDKRFLAILAAIVIIFIGIVAINKNGSGNSSSTNNQTPPTHHVEGNGKSGVTLVEYGDYECPICELYYQPVKQAVAQYSDQIYFQFRNLPLTSIHPNAFAGARAAEAAGMQGKYWQMHDKLYDNQTAWATSNNPSSYFNTYAQQIGLNLTKFKQDYASSQVNNSINADLAAFAKTGQQEATPTFFLNGKYLPNTELSDPTTGQPSATFFANVLNAEIKIQSKAHSNQ